MNIYDLEHKQQMEALGFKSQPITQEEKMADLERRLSIIEAGNNKLQEELSLYQTTNGVIHTELKINHEKLRARFNKALEILTRK